jgi:DUF1680 family protein
MRRYAPTDFTQVRITGNFWRERLETVLSKTIPTQYEQLERHGILDSLKVVQPPPPLRIPVGNHGMSTQVFWDSDVGKWIEAASYALAHRRDAAIEARIDEIVERLASAQSPDGYLNCWYIGREIDKRWSNLRDRHELYCAGHLLEGAIAYWQATDRRRLLEIMLRYIEHVGAMFGRGLAQKRGYCGHQEIELALIKLYHATNQRKYLELASYFIDERGAQPPHYFDLEAIARGDNPSKYWFRSYEYNQSHKPVRQQDKVVGHAVRAMYMYSAMADLAADLGDESLLRACETLWQDLICKRMYVTAGLGPSVDNEGFTKDYELPNDTAYAETCASVALIFWAQRMLNLDCDGRYADVLERALYNGALSGLSRDGAHYFYQNVLESDGSHQRWEWHPCPCCTMNVARLVASIGGYFYSTGDDAVCVHLYGANEANLIVDGRAVRLRQEEDYPWSGANCLSLDLDATMEFTLRLRIPNWARQWSASINGERVDVEPERGYLNLRRAWSPGDTVELDLPMPVDRLYADPRVRADIGRVALRRGPIIYCVEEADNPTAPIALARLPRSAAVAEERHASFFDGAVTLMAEMDIAEPNGGEPLYHNSPFRTSKAKVKAIPYYLWANRGPNRMMVWLPES